MESRPGWLAITLSSVAACGGVHAPPEARATGPVYAPLFEVGHTWNFPVEVLDEVEGAPPHRTALGPAHCAVASVHDDRAARLTTITCNDAEPGVAPPPLAGRFVATRVGLWTWTPPDDSEDPEQMMMGVDQLDPDQMLVAATPAEVHRKTLSGCLGSPPLREGSGTDNVQPPDGSYSLMPWKQAWCATIVRGCNSTWIVQCFRADVGWIGGAWHGHPDPASSLWQEVRWGEAPAYGFGT